MIELGLAIAASFLMKSIAELENLPGKRWGALTFGLFVLGAFTMPIPYISILLAMIATYAIMFVYLQKRKK